MLRSLRIFTTDYVDQTAEKSSYDADSLMGLTVFGDNLVPSRIEGNYLHLSAADASNLQARGVLNTGDGWLVVDADVDPTPEELEWQKWDGSEYKQ